MIRVFIVASSPLARAGLENLLSARAVKIVGQAMGVDSLGDELAGAEADVLLIDVSSESPEQVIDALSESGLTSEIPVVVLADQAFGEKSAEALRSGIRGVLPSDLPSEQLVVALQAVVAGFVVIHPVEVAAIVPAVTSAVQSLAELAEPLTRREREVLQMLASGLGNKEIAARLNISDHTAKFHVASIMGKLGAGSRTEAVAIGIRRGLVLL